MTPQAVAPPQRRTLRSHDLSDPGSPTDSALLSRWEHLWTKRAEVKVLALTKCHPHCLRSKKVMEIHSRQMLQSEWLMKC